MMIEQLTSEFHEISAKKIIIDDRYLRQNARKSIADIYDILVELVTNSDDSYQKAHRTGRIEIEILRRRGSTESEIRVRDFAQGMTLAKMEEGLSQYGRRVSGLDRGECVRGTNSRGAKDIVNMGNAEFRSIAHDGKYHSAKLTSDFRFIPGITDFATKHREELGIPDGTGTLVCLKTNERIPQHDTLIRDLSTLVPLSEILKEREVIVKDISQGRVDKVFPRTVEKKKVLTQSFDIPGYEKARAKLVIYRAKKPFARHSKAQFRQGGIRIKSKRGIHEATLFDPGLEYEPAAAIFFGKLTCEYIDELWNDFDEKGEKGQAYAPENPVPILDPMRRQGLDRQHPFTKELFKQALRRLRPLIEEERKRREGERKNIENRYTRSRLAKLEKEATKFLKKYLEQVELARELTDKETPSGFLAKGYSVSPPFAQIVLGQAVKYTLQIRLDAFPELSVGDTVEIHCHSNEVSSNKRYGQLEKHPTKEGILRCNWIIKGEKVVATTGIRVRAGAIDEDCLITVVVSEKDLFSNLTALEFNKKKYTVQVGGKRTLKVRAPYPAVISEQSIVQIDCDDPHFTFSGDRTLLIRQNLGIVEAKIRVECQKPDKRGTVTAKVGNLECSAELVSDAKSGDPIRIKVVDEDFGTQRSRWRGNLLEIAARHPSLKRYLGPQPDFLGQEEKHFRVVVAEVVADAVCQRIIGKRVEEAPQEYNDYDWDAFYMEYTELMTEFLPVAHQLQVPG